jgi:hypothetical protein
VWPGKKDKEGIHLIRWDKLANPKKQGVCGLKNIFFVWENTCSKKLVEMPHGNWTLARGSCKKIP